MFYAGRAVSAGDDPERRRAFNELWESPAALRVFRIITAAWGVGLTGETSVRTVLAVVLSTGTFLAASPVLAGVVIGGLFAFIVGYTRRALRRSEELIGAATTLTAATWSGRHRRPDCASRY